MQFEVEHLFDRPVDDVLRMFTDQAYFERKLPLTGAGAMKVVKCETQGGRFMIRFSFNSAADIDLPDIARKVMPSTDVRVTEIDTWDRQTRKGRLEIDLGGLPISVGADMSLTPRGQGCVNTLRWTIKVSIPMIGGKLEKLIGEDMQKKLARDYEISKQLLSDY